MNSMNFNLTPEDEYAIRELPQRMMDGWNTLDAEAFAAPFAEDADYIVIDGSHLCGRPAIAAGHEQIFNTIYRDSQLDLSVEKIRALDEKIALVHVNAHLRFQLEGVEHNNLAQLSLVCAKNKDNWQIEGFQNTPIAQS